MESRLRSKNRQRAAAIGVLFQEAETRFSQQCRTEVAFGLKLQRLSAEEISRRTQAALRLCQLTDVTEAHPLDLHAAHPDEWRSPVWRRWRRRCYCWMNPAGILTPTG
ncbi:hypothetical protein KCP71_10860 [Salmonella enterica subsp. enterica]|nr:hypothetical protein KCP71_10860 [Salmonella enterica subsp. enterica]